MLGSGEMIVAPGAYDGGTAMLVEAAGFPAVYMTGAGVAATYGLPDYGLITLTEMAERAGIIARSVDIPVIADADTGYGNELNVTRTVREYEIRGVAAIQIEDQVSPKKCGHLAGKEVVPRSEFVSKVRAAVAARSDPDLMIVARTDARAELGLEEAVARANDALAAGADMIFVEATQTAAEAAVVPRQVNGPCMLNMVMGGMTPVFDLAEAEAMGYRLTIVPAVVFGTMVGCTIEALAALKDSGRHPPLPGGLTPSQLFAHFGAERWDRLRLSLASA